MKTNYLNTLLHQITDMRANLEDKLENTDGTLFAGLQNTDRHLAHAQTELRMHIRLIEQTEPRQTTADTAAEPAPN